MKCLCDVKCRIMKDVDMFGKDPELYYKGRPKKTSWIGRILSFAFVFVYFAFFLYKLIRMLKRIDVTFYDTFTYASKPPAVTITHNNFYIAFSLEEPKTYNPFIDEGIYYPKAYFKRAEMKGDNFVWKEIELEVEQCKLEKFGESYKKVFKNIDLDNFYCFKDINNYILEGHFSYYLYSFFYVQFFPCINTTNNQKCKPIEEIDYYLKNTFVTFGIEDIELTPKNFKNPTRPRNKNVYTTVGKKLFQEIHAFFEVVNIETDLDWFGLNEIEKIKSEIFLKYDETFIMSNLIENDIYETGEAFCDVTFKLSENVRTQRRVYTKFVTILGDIGGFMEVIFTLFRIISSMLVDILYEISMVNRLFNFDSQNKLITIKFGENNILKTTDKQNDEHNISTINIRKNQDNATNTTRERISKKSKKYMFTSGASSWKSQSKMKDAESDIERRINIREYLGFKRISKESEDKIRLNRACVYFLFCFVRKRKIISNVFLDEGMDLISKRLDIFNIFKKMYILEHSNDFILNKTIPMSIQSKKRLKFILSNDKVI